MNGKFDPTILGPVAREGWREPGIEEYTYSGRVTNHRSVESRLIVVGSMRRIANAAGITTPFRYLTKDEVRKLVAAIRKAKDNTRPYFTFLRGFYKYWELDAGDRNLKKVVPEPEASRTNVGPNDVLTIDEINRVLEAGPSLRDRVLNAMCMESGGRISEVLGLDVEDLERFENGDGKPWFKAWIGRQADREELKEAGTEHFIFVRRPAAVAILERWLKEYPVQVAARPRPLIPSLSRAAREDQRLVLNSVDDIMAQVEKKSGIAKHLHAHLWRHTQATMLLREGLPEATIRQMMGWRPGSTMLHRYAHLASTDAERALGLTADKGQKAEVLVPKSDVPIMPADPFADSGVAMAKRMAALEEQMQAQIAFLKKRADAIEAALKDEAREPTDADREGGGEP